MTPATILWSLTIMTVIPPEMTTTQVTQVVVAGGGPIHAEAGWSCSYSADPAHDPKWKQFPYVARTIDCRRGDSRVSVGVGCSDRDHDEASLTLSEGDGTPLTVIDMKCDRSTGASPPKQ